MMSTECARADVRADATDSATEAQCKGLESADFTTIQDAPTRIVDAKSVNATPSTPDYCAVTGYIAPNVGIRIGLPRAWNGKFIHLGCGGSCGLFDDTYFSQCGYVMRKGYACIVTDMGHRGIGVDYVWAYNDLQEKTDFGVRAAHVATIAGKAITERFYARAPQKSYFMGCSTGGREGMQEAQIFPWDFDGIIAGAPPIRFSEALTAWIWGFRTMHTPDGRPIMGLPELELLNKAALSQCDKDDGLMDGVIGSPSTCRFDPAVLACRGDQKSGCLNPAQVSAAKRIYQGPATSSGIALSSAGPMPGSEFNPAPGVSVGTGWHAVYIGDAGKLTFYTAVSEEALRFLMFDRDPGPSWHVNDFDFDRDYKRFGITSPLYDAANPDLERFRDAGGKLIMYIGTNDTAVPVRGVLGYYDRVSAVMGGRQKAQQFARLFVMPGVGHCLGGPGADTVDYLSALESWVERGQPPERLVAYHMKAAPSGEADSGGKPEVGFSRPLFPYPAEARYRGSGDPGDERSFTAIHPKERSRQP
jgi:feruloyl esterase